MTKLIIICSLLFTAALFAYTQQGDFPKLTGPYFGQKPPVNKPELFAPGLISNGIDHCSPSFSPDGKEIYFEIMTRNNITKIGFTRLVNGAWMKPDTIPFSKKQSFQEGNPFITPDGKKIFFSSFRPGAVSVDKENIWYSERTPNGWSDPKPVSSAVNNLRIHWSISISGSGNLYFQGTKLDNSESGGIYYSKLVNGEYTSPVKMDNAINLPGTMTSCPNIAPDESYLVFTRIGKGPEDSGIFISFSDKSGNWLPAVMLEGGSIDRGGLSPLISPDRKYLFYVNGGVFWMPVAKKIEELKLK